MADCRLCFSPVPFQHSFQHLPWLRFLPQPRCPLFTHHHRWRMSRFQRNWRVRTAWFQRRSSCAGTRYACGLAAQSGSSPCRAVCSASCTQRGCKVHWGHRGELMCKYFMRQWLSERAPSSCCTWVSWTALYFIGKSSGVLHAEAWWDGTLL